LVRKSKKPEVLSNKWLEDVLSKQNWEHYESGTRAFESIKLNSIPDMATAMIVTSLFEHRKTLGKFVYQAKGNNLERIGRSIVLKPKKDKKFSISKIFTVDYTPEPKGIVNRIT